MSTTQPIVSVLMTAYNRQNYIAEAIESVLASTLTGFELIIVDDGSTDNTVAIAKNYAVQDERVKVYVNEKNLGDYHNRNKAASYATGKYLKYWDSDDVMYPHCLQVMVAAMDKFPQAGFGLIKPHLLQNNRPYPFLIEEPFRHFFKDSTLFNNSPGSAIFKKELFDALGGFSGTRYIGDYEFFLKCAQNTPLVIVAGFLGWDRVHEVQERNFDPVQYEALRLQVLFAAVSKNKQISIEEKNRFLADQKHFFKTSLSKDLLKLRWKNFLSRLSLLKYLKLNQS